MLGIGASGLFAAASKIPNVMNMVSSTFWQAWSLSAFQEFKKTDTGKFYSNVFAVFRTFCFLAGIGTHAAHSLACLIAAAEKIL